MLEKKVKNSFEDYQLAKSLGFADDAKKNLDAMVDSYGDATQELEDSAKWGPVLKFLMENKRQPLNKDSFKMSGLEVNIGDLWNFLEAKYGESVSFAKMNLPSDGGIMRIGETDFFFSLANGYIKIFKPAPDSPMVTNYNSYKNGLKINNLNMSFMFSQILWQNQKQKV